MLVAVRRTARVPRCGAVPMLRLRLEGGHELLASGAHPTPAAARLWDRKRGDVLGELLIEAGALQYLQLDATYDLLPASATGVYWADGAPLASTLQ